MLKPLPLLLALALPCTPANANADVELDLDLRMVASDGRDSFLDGGLGKLRFDDSDDGLRLGRARLGLRGSPGGNWHLTLDASIWSAQDNNLIDVTEAYAEWRPVPDSAWRSKVKIGAFYAPVSLEHRSRGWTNPYTISSSALNTWVGEELRTIGASYSMEYVGTAEGGAFDAGAEVAAFGWNDPAGVIVAFRGFALHDRQTPLWGRIGTAPLNGPAQRVLFKEIDNHVGFHVGGHVRLASGLELRALRYDNQADPAAFDPGIRDYAWDTRFNSIGLRQDLPSGTTLIAQALEGVTDIGPGAHDRWSYRTSFLLLSHDWKQLRVAGRVDWFEMRQLRTVWPGELGDDTGRALTLAATWRFDERFEVVAEWLRIESRYNGRLALGEAPRAVERSLQLALRLAL